MHFASLFPKHDPKTPLLTREDLFRIGLIGAGCLAASLGLGTFVFMLWYVAYLCSAVLERLFAHRMSDSPTRRDVALHWASSLLVGIVYSGCLIFVWTLDTPVTHLATGLMFAGAVLNTFMLRSKTWWLGLAYLTPLCGAMFWIASTFFAPPLGGAGFWVSSILCVLMACYLGFSLWEADRSQRELDQTRMQFIQAQKFESLGTVTTGISHDFNNLLSVIQGNLELLKLYPNASDREEFVDEALRATARGSDLAKLLTAHGRKQPQLAQRVDTADVLRGIQDFSARILPANIALHTLLPPRGKSIKADDTSLHSALLNLVINARDAMPKGGDLHIYMDEDATPPDALRLTDTGGYIAFVVSDTGQGIPEDQLDAVRDPFFSTKPEGKGSGLGLPMVCSFAHQFSGGVDIQSKLGKGTTVRLFLPKS